MKKALILIGLLLTHAMFSQETGSADISHHETLINTIGENAITINLKIDLSKKNLEGYEIDDEKFNDLKKDLNPRLVQVINGQEIIFSDAKVNVSVSKTAISFEIKPVSDELISQLTNGTSDLYIKVDTDILFEVWKNQDESTLKTLKVTTDQIKKFSQSKSYLTEEMARELIDAKGGEIYLTQNTFDLGIIPAEQSSSSKTELNASFSYRTKYSFLKNTPIYFSAEGLIGTNSRDSLNYISVYPVGYNFLKGTHQFVGQLGIEGNQDFSNYRISSNFFWNGIIPNLVDLTFGEDRLRLKPVLKAGVKFYQEIKNNRPIEIDDNEFSNQVFMEYYYYVPIHKIYSLILEGTLFYDFNTSVNAGKKAMFNYSAVLGVDIPKTAFKTIFKYSKGENGISYQRDDYYIIGLMIDAFGLN